ncbi:MAG TPA: 8-amino-7-oxononanoate synthase [Candidatus Limnocylindrales bacterium]|nr:8-amino-7-oxononanoate synthase [Candidatus Limnocylindrales bacterium]
MTRPSSSSSLRSTAGALAASPAASPAANTAAEPDTADARRPSLDEVLAGELAAIDARGLRRRLRRIAGAQGPVVEIDGRRVVLLCSNNYLGLADHPAVLAAAAAETRAHGASAVSSRLISGHMEAHARLEESIALWKRTEAALVYSTGYQANIGVLTALLGSEDVVVSDELNHASIIDGCRLSRARVAIYRHADVEDLRHVLAQCAGARRVLVVTESVFSMDGDIAPLREIVDAARDHEAWVMVDEAHGAGVFGPRGAGVVAELGLTASVDVQMGTLGKALGSFGAYVAGSRRLIDHLLNRSRSFIFTTGLPPSCAAAADAALDVIEQEPQRAAQLRTRARQLGLRLREAGLDVSNLDSQILPILIGDASRTVAAADALLQRGFYVAAIRPPTVPPGTSRLRLSLMATHTDEQIENAFRALVEVLGGTGR